MVAAEVFEHSWMSVCCECCVLSGRGFCDGKSPEQRINTVCGVSECDGETSITSRPWPTGGLLQQALAHWRAVTAGPGHWRVVTADPGPLEGCYSGPWPTGGLLQQALAHWRAVTAGPGHWRAVTADSGPLEGCYSRPWPLDSCYSRPWPTGGLLQQTLAYWRVVTPCEKNSKSLLHCQIEPKTGVVITLFCVKFYISTYRTVNLYICVGYRDHYSVFQLSTGNRTGMWLCACTNEWSRLSEIGRNFV